MRARAIRRTSSARARGIMRIRTTRRRDLANLGGTGRAGGEDLRAGCRPPRTPPLARACGAVVRTTRAEGSIPASLTCLPRRLECENRLSTPTGREKSKGSSRCKPAARARWPRPASGQPASRARGRAEARARLRRQPAGRRWFVRACGGSAQPEGVGEQRCKGNESCSRVRRCARARSRHRDVTRRAQRPSRVRLRRRTTFDEQDPVLRLNAGQNRRRAKGRSSRSELRVAETERCGLKRNGRNLFQIFSKSSCTIKGCESRAPPLN